jgi:hypothetical protein
MLRLTDNRGTRRWPSSCHAALGPDLLGLLEMKRLSGLVVLERGALQVHTLFRRPDRGGIRTGGTDLIW